MLIGSYSPALVSISLFVAVLASYTALDLAGRIATAQGRAAHLWMSGGALAMGVGIWSMHFIGMLAFSLPVALATTYRSRRCRCWSRFFPAVLPCGWSASHDCRRGNWRSAR